MNTTKILVALLVFAALALAGCAASQNAQEGFRSVSPDEAKSMLASEDIFLIDVHVPEQEHIPGTNAFIPYSEIEKYKEKLPNDKSKKILVYCMSGPMGETAAKKLLDMGYKNVYNLKGGIVAWKRAGY